jgi:hypothetical protein
MDSLQNEPRFTPVTGNGHAAEIPRKRFDPTRIFVEKDRLTWFWFGFAMLVLAGSAVDRIYLVQSFKQRERVIVVDPASTFYVSPLLKFSEAKELHAQQSTLVQVSSVVSNREAADNLISEALQAGPLEPNCYRTEYAHALLCRGEVERGHKNFEQAGGAYREALQHYELMEMRWGIVRSTVGLNLIGQRRELPIGLGLEGCDAVVWSRFKEGGKFAPGMLCENLP